MGRQEGAGRCAQQDKGQATEWGNEGVVSEPRVAMTELLLFYVFKRVLLI